MAEPQVIDWGFRRLGSLSELFLVCVMTNMAVGVGSTGESFSSEE